MQSTTSVFGGFFGADPERFWTIAIALLLFGFSYNWLIDYVHKHGLNEGYVWLEVVVGVAVTVIAAGFIIGWLDTFRLFFFFACSGFFMAFGDIRRYVMARRAESRDDGTS